MSTRMQVSAIVLCPSPDHLGHPTAHQPASSPSVAQDASTPHLPLPPAAPLQDMCHRIGPPQPPAGESLDQASAAGTCAATSELAANMHAVGAGADSAKQPLAYNSLALQLWVLEACQGPRGGLRDKPGKPPDYYHTCYCLSGLASAQHAGGWVLGPIENLLQPADTLCNVLDSRLCEALSFFGEHQT